MLTENGKTTGRGCKHQPHEVLLNCGNKHLENGNSAQSTVAELRDITTRNGCTVTLIFCDHPNPGVRRAVAEMLLRSFQKRSEAT